MVFRDVKQAFKLLYDDDFAIALKMTLHGAIAGRHFACFRILRFHVT